MSQRQRPPYRRHLPHLAPDGYPVFLTWNLKGALPRDVVERLQRVRMELEKRPARRRETPKARQLRLHKTMFGITDRYLDATTKGPLYLKDPKAAQIVEESILFGVPERYALYAFVVMPNHVHVLVTPMWTLQKITQGIKGFTAYKINSLRGARGQTLWQDESYDHWVRDEEELHRIIAYIENNPVRAGLCARPGDWRWSSASRRSSWPVGWAFQPDVDYLENSVSR